jgi:hypothetical protein
MEPFFSNDSNVPEIWASCFFEVPYQYKRIKSHYSQRNLPSPHPSPHRGEGRVRGASLQRNKCVRISSSQTELDKSKSFLLEILVLLPFKRRREVLSRRDDCKTMEVLK